jgi:putative protease
MNQPVIPDLIRNPSHNIELLAPAGDLEKLIVAIEYGADAVYFGGEIGSLRTSSDNFSIEDIREGVRYARARGVRTYLAMNIYAHEVDIKPLTEYTTSLAALPAEEQPDAFIVTDPGILLLLKKIYDDKRMPEIHLSTQASVTNAAAATFWHEQGVRRIVLARELSLAEITQIRGETPERLEIEAFVHGAMCVSYSGRCLLSNVMTGRDANQGDCSQPCRYSYRLVEEKRPGLYMPVEEDTRGTYIMNAKDLCMLPYIRELADAGVTSFKIEGRVKSIFYIATVVRVYRQAIDEYLLAEAEGRSSVFDPEWTEELTKASNRQYSTGFFFGKPNEDDQNYENSGYQRNYSFIGVVTDYDAERGLAKVEQRNKFSVGEHIEIFGPGSGFIDYVIEELYDEEMNPVGAAPHAQQKVYLPVPVQVVPYSMLRRKEAPAVIK